MSTSITSASIRTPVRPPDGVGGHVTTVVVGAGRSAGVRGQRKALAGSSPHAWGAGDEPWAEPEPIDVGANTPDARPGAVADALLGGISSGADRRGRADLRSSIDPRSSPECYFFRDLVAFS